MCGILFSVGPLCNEVNDERLIPLLFRRGPDGTNVKNVEAQNQANEPLTLCFVASVLALRGDDIVKQPVEDTDTGCITCWNGEAWKIGGDYVRHNDTMEVHHGLVAAARSNHAFSSVSVDHVMKYLASIDGPYAFVFYDALNSKIYFGRDFLGRRSLLFKTGLETFVLSSTSDGNSNWAEVDTNAVYVLNLRSTPSTSIGVTSSFSAGSSYLEDCSLKITSLPWANYGKVLAFNRNTPPVEIPGINVDSASVSTLEKLFVSSISTRIGKLPAKDAETPRPDRVNNITANSTAESELAAAKVRNNQSPGYAVLFSGGLDCSILARVLHDHLPIEEEIDLLNVAFENPRVTASSHDANVSPFDLCPDRQTARKSYRELFMACPNRKWHLVQIDIPYNTYQEHRNEVMSLMQPHDTEMDLSIAMALYFAARADGKLRGVFTEFPYRSEARVLFSGLGADELFGGYQRHATAFNRGGYEALLESLELDVSRLPTRNLGRDDRVIAHWGREVRYPYLDEEFLQWAVQAPVWEKCGFGQNTLDAEDPFPIEAGKRILRLFALKLGLTGIAAEKKRAIQFGARTANMDGRYKGTDAVKKVTTASE